MRQILTVHPLARERACFFPKGPLSPAELRAFCEERGLNLKLGMHEGSITDAAGERVATVTVAYFFD